MNYKFGERLSEAIRLRNITYVDLANKTGCGKSTIESYCTNACNPSAKVIFKLAGALKVSADWLLGMTDNMNPPPIRAQEKTKPRETKTVYVRKTVVVTKDMTDKEALLFVSDYTGLTPEAVCALHRTRHLKIKWKEKGQ